MYKTIELSLVPIQFSELNMCIHTYIYKRQKKKIKKNQTLHITLDKTLHHADRVYMYLRVNNLNKQRVSCKCVRVRVRACRRMSRVSRFHNNLFKTTKHFYFRSIINHNVFIAVLIIYYSEAELGIVRVVHQPCTILQILFSRAGRGGKKINKRRFYRRIRRISSSSAI